MDGEGGRNEGRLEGRNGAREREGGGERERERERERGKEGRRGGGTKEENMNTVYECFLYQSA